MVGILSVHTVRKAEGTSSVIDSFAVYITKNGIAAFLAFFKWVHVEVLVYMGIIDLQ